ncbi:hypothetical protein CRG98_039750 [Punica granatum]|uniref:RNase H type-1 domain-containing protein n=1 Tax=Punica granatum TaxID=22663 RepID=A0A2I0I774_PUNGR|nr:hypothetical protein CRG98_039750 [Punica granatum]
MPGLDPSIVEHFLPLNTEKFPPKRQQLRRQWASLLLRIKEEVVKQINVGFLEVCNYSEWVANIVPVEKKDGRSGIGAVLISPDGHYYPVAAKIDFPCTNNVAEYEACIFGLQAAIDFKLVPYHEYLEKLAENFEDVSFTYTPRMTNQFANALATLASMVSITRENLIEPLEIEIAERPAHCYAIEASEVKPWYEDIKNLLQTDQYPPFADRRDGKTLRRLAIHYFLSGEILYRHSFDSTLLRSKTSLRRPRQKLGNEGHDLKSRKGESRQKESINHFLARSKTSSRRPRQKLEDPRGAISPERGNRSKR